MMETCRHPMDGSRRLSASVVSLGNFDGLHLGHRQLLGHAVARAREVGIPSVAITFDPHPALVVAPERKPRLLSTPRQKLAILQELGLDYAWVVPFSRAFSELEPLRFLELLARTAKPVELHVGSAFRFGKDRTGDLEVLQAWGATVGCRVQGHGFRDEEGEPISSSRVRALLEEGEVQGAARLLGRPYSLTGVVEDGDRRGRHLGFPTANLAWEQEQLPAPGVYITQVQGGPLEGLRLGMTNIGEKPTFQGLRLTVETYLPDFSGDLYGSHLEVGFLRRLRGEQRFASLDDLVAQIQRDVEAGQAWWTTRASNL